MLGQATRELRPLQPVEGLSVSEEKPLEGSKQGMTRWVCLFGEVLWLLHGARWGVGAMGGQGRKVPVAAVVVPGDSMQEGEAVGRKRGWIWDKF